ncbi:MAG: hypothetical protein LR017_04000 [Candidatus Pacebacteria bacterium]|nr:hypothetical protein [Candidatus Paceibacterota bacterium]
MSDMTPLEKKDFYKRFDTLEKSIDRILGILESDDKIKEQGLVEKVNSMNRKLTDLLTREKVYKAKATTWGVIGGAVGTALFWFVKVLFTKFAI